MSIYSYKYENSEYSFYKNGKRVPGCMSSAVEELHQLEAQLAALKEENERLKEEFKMSEYSANLANICREEWKTTAIEYSNEVVALNEENERLKARVAELEREDTLWAMLDAIEKALFRRAAPHAWEAIVTEAGMKFITDRRKEPANEG